MKRLWDRDWNRFPLFQPAYLSCISAKPSKDTFVSTGLLTKTEKKIGNFRVCILTRKAKTLSGFHKSEMDAGSAGFKLIKVED